MSKPFSAAMVSYSPATRPVRPPTLPMALPSRAVQDEPKISDRVGLLKREALTSPETEGLSKFARKTPEEKGVGAIKLVDTKAALIPTTDISPPNLADLPSFGARPAAHAARACVSRLPPWLACVFE